MTPLPGTAVPPWSPANVAAIMAVIDLLSILVAMEASAVLGQTFLSLGSIKYTDFLLDVGASHATIPLCFSLSSILQGTAPKNLADNKSLSKHRRQARHLPLRKRLTQIYVQLK